MLRGVVFWLIAIIPWLAAIASPKLRVDSALLLLFIQSIRELSHHRFESQRQSL
jgi:hypothetical protein